MDDRVVKRLLLVGFLLVFSACGQSGKPDPRTDSDATHAVAHGDHRPRHGGQFFMSEDLEHHLEGALFRSGEVRVYLFDARTLPLPSGALSKAAATLHHGDSPDSPGFPLATTPGYLSFAVGDIALPCTFTLLMRFPDWPESAAPETFTFVFDKYSG